MSNIYVEWKNQGGITLGGFNTGFSGGTRPPSSNLTTELAATCGYCQNVVTLKEGQVIYMGDPRLCEHVQRHGAPT